MGGEEDGPQRMDRLGPGTEALTEPPGRRGACLGSAAIFELEDLWQHQQNELMMLMMLWEAEGEC